MHRRNFRKIGYNDIISHFDPTYFKQFDISGIGKKINLDINKKILAFAPFSTQKSKVYPLDKMEKVISYFANKNKEYQTIILGGGFKEEEIVNNWKEKCPNIISVINKLSFFEEIALIAQSNIVVSMDSANMHLASPTLFYLGREIMH